MADILGLVASILQLVNTVAQAREYIQGFRSAREEQEKLLLEIKNLQPLLTQLHQRIQSSQAAGATSATQDFKKPLDQLKVTLDQFAKKLRPTSIGRKVVSRLTWPLWGNSDVQEALSTVERFKTTLGGWLAMGIWDSTRRIEATVQDMPGIRATVQDIPGIGATVRHTDLAVDALGQNHQALTSTVAQAAEEQRTNHAGFTESLANIADGQNDLLATVNETAEEQRTSHAYISKSIAPIVNDQDAEKREKVIKWYSPLNFFLLQEDLINAHHPGTGHWFLENEIFTEWKSESGKVLWCTGKPGAGKTILASIVVQHLRTGLPDDNIGVGAIYLNYKENNAHSPSKLLAALWRQLVLKKPISTVEELYNNHREPGTRPSIDDDLRVLRSVISEYSKVFIIVDALDEYLQRNRLLQLLAQLVPTVNLMLTSRPPIVKYHFANSLIIDITATVEDIRAYIGGKIGDSTCLSKHLRDAPGLKAEIEEKVVQRNAGMFLLAKLRINSLLELPTISSVRKALASMPDGLDQTYDLTMARINSQNKANRSLAQLILLWITNAKRPLKPDELREALAVKPDDKALNRENLIDDDTMLSVCAGLVEINKKDYTVRLIHYTIQDYLEPIQSREFPDAAIQITTTCLTYLSFDLLIVFWYSSSSRMVNVQHAFLRYAAEYWMVHARGKPESHIVPLIHSFLTRPPGWLKLHIWYSTLGTDSVEDPVEFIISTSDFPTDSPWRALVFQLDGFFAKEIDTISKDICAYIHSTDLSVIVASLARLFHDPDSFKEFLAACNNSQVVLDVLQTLLDHDSFVTARPLLFKVLLWRSSEYRVYPTCFASTGLVEQTEQLQSSLRYRHFGAILKRMIGRQVVALEVFEPFINCRTTSENFTRFGYKAFIWRQLSHPNILPFFGISYFNHRLCLVSPWMENGNIQQHLDKNSPGMVDRLSLILDIALGLEYLHKNNVVHGQLHWSKIFVTSARRACIAGFSLATIGQTTDATQLRSDMYAFARVCYQILTGKIPLISDSYRPARPESYRQTLEFNNLWGLIYDCWKEDPTERPLIGEVVEQLVGPSIRATRTPPTMDWDETLMPKFRRAQQAKPLKSWITQLEQSRFRNGFLTQSPSNKDTVYTIVRLVRLILNITPQNEPSWWPQKLESPMTEILASLSELEVFLLRRPKDPSKTLEDIVTMASTGFLPALKKLDSGDSNLHNGQDVPATQLVKFGPYGYSPVIHFLDSLFTAARKSAPVLPERQLESLMNVVENAAASIYAHTLAFRSSRLREHYDPDGVARLDKAMRETRQKFPIREEYDSQLEFLKLNIRWRWTSVSQVEKAITVHFGSTWMVAEIKASSLQMGPHGIDGFFEHVVCYVVDEMPVDGPNYRAKLRLIQRFCEILAIRMETFTERML